MIEIRRKSQVRVFDNEQFGQIRTIVRDGGPWFVAADVCRALEIGQVTNTIRRLDDDEKTLISIKGISRGNDQVNIVNESGLYTLVLSSRKPEAKAFKRWITHEVIPAIRRDGGYIAVKREDTPEQLMARALRVADETIKRQQSQIDTMKPKAVFADAVDASKTSILVGELSKLLKQNGVEIGQNRLFKRLREDGYLGTRGECYNLPTQRSMDAGLFELKESTITQPDGSIRITRTTKVTGRGQIYFINRFLAIPNAEED